MKIIDEKDQELTLKLSYSELLILNNALNEIINGIEIPESNTRIGYSKEYVTSLLNKINKLL
ncbi:hypothetical protein GF362_03230 [Candidatus Dojkabacteria bacterium]|nr:hypothetical protein [Candidatus Dojkabacteria bacterium]